ncbi:MAG: c-type cytochrome [Verrucomicrobiota bacterium]
MWRQSGPIVLFILGIVAAFVYFANAIPQIKSERVEAVSKIGASPEELVTAGKRLFLGDRAQCLACHSLGEDPKARCPNLEGVGSRAAQRKPGASAAEYLVESLYNPNAYIVPGYPRNQMTPAHKPPVALAHDEILALVVFLNALGGQSDEPFIQQVHKAQEPWRQGLLQPEAAEEAKLPILPGDAGRGAEIFQRLGCAGCHRVGAEGGQLGPDLTAIGASQSAEYILESCLDPNAVLVRGFKQLTVVWTNPALPELQGLPLAWSPNKEQPQTLRLSVDEEGGREEKEVDLSKVAQVGDTVVTVEREGKTALHVGDYVSGDEKTGVTLLFWEPGRWVERHIVAAGIQSIRLPSSPMPAIFGEAMTPRETYDLLAYLLAQKGRR